MSKTIKTVSLAVVALVAIYLGYQLLERWMNPCEGVFQQSAVGLNTKLDVIKTKGEFAIGRQNVQELKDRAQEVALNLKACCIVLGKTSGEFLRCKEGFDKYDAAVKNVAALVTEAEAAKEQGQSEIAVQKIAEANEGLKNAETKAQALAQQVAEIKGKDKGREGPSGTGGAQAGGQTAPVATGYARVYFNGSPGKGRLQVKVNGVLVGQYDQYLSQYLDPLLTPGANNTITFTFSQTGGSVDVVGYLPGSKESIMILRFVTGPDKLEESIQIPYVGGKK
jgi:hypothetical protein